MINCLVLVKISSSLLELEIFFFFIMAAPAAYEGSQVRGRIRAAATGLHHNLWQHGILNP